MANGQVALDPRANIAAQIAQTRAVDPMIDASQLPMTSREPMSLPMPVLPPANPVDPYQIASEQIERQRALAAQVAPLLARQEAMSRPQSPINPEGIPKVGLTDEPWMKMQPVTGQGFGGGVKNLLGDIAKGLLLGVASTGPGRSIQGAIYQPGARRYEAAKGELANQIADIQKQQQLEEAPVGPMGELAYHQELIGTKEDQNRIRQQLADQARINEQDKDANAKAALQIRRQTADLAATRLNQQFNLAMRSFQLRAKNLSREEARDQMDAMLRDQANKNYSARTQAGQEEKEASLATATDMAQAKIDADKWLQRTFGIQPKIPPRKNLTPGGGGGGSTVRFQDSRGGIHDIPAANLPAARQRDPGLRVLSGGER